MTATLTPAELQRIQRRNGRIAIIALVVLALTLTGLAVFLPKDDRPSTDPVHRFYDAHRSEIATVQSTFDEARGYIQIRDYEACYALMEIREPLFDSMLAEPTITAEWSAWIAAVGNAAWQCQRSNFALANQSVAEAVYAYDAITTHLTN